MKSSRILIADAHPVRREGIAGLLGEGAWEICAFAADGEEAVRLAAAQSPDIAILDQQMPILSGLEAAGQIQERLPAVEILLFTNASSPRALLEVFHSRVGACLLKTEPREELIFALEALRRHHRFRSRELTALCEATAAAAGKMAKLTAREIGVLRLIGAGLSTKEIATKLGVSTKTIDTHRGNMIHKWNVRSAIEVFREAVRSGLVEL